MANYELENPFKGLHGKVKRSDVVIFRGGNRYKGHCYRFSDKPRKTSEATQRNSKAIQMAQQRLQRILHDSEQLATWQEAVPDGQTLRSYALKILVRQAYTELSALNRTD